MSFNAELMISAAKALHKPFLIAALAGFSADVDVVEKFCAADMSVFCSPESALKALSSVNLYRRFPRGETSD